MLTLHYYSNASGIRAAMRQVGVSWWGQEDEDPVYSRDLIKEFDVENPPLDDELAWILSKGKIIKDPLSSSFIIIMSNNFGASEASSQKLLMPLSLRAKNSTRRLVSCLLCRLFVFISYILHFLCTLLFRITVYF